jgi:hypothetical protein
MLIWRPAIDGHHWTIKLFTAATNGVLGPIKTPSLVALHHRANAAVMAAMGTKSREVIWGGQIMGAKIHARHAREEAKKAAREADRAAAFAWSVQMDGYGGPAQPSEWAVDLLDVDSTVLERLDRVRELQQCPRGFIGVGEGARIGVFHECGPDLCTPTFGQIIAVWRRDGSLSGISGNL